MQSFKKLFPFSWRDLGITLAALCCAVEICNLLQMAHSSDGYAYAVFVLAVLVTARFTDGYLFGLASALAGVVAVNYIFTYPYREVNFTISGYPLTTLAFLAVSLTTTALTAQTKQQELLRTENEREKMRANLLRSVSHDIRTPLTSIIGATSAVLDNPGMPQADQRALLEDVRDEAHWLIRVVENLLSITRMESDSAQITKEPEAAEEVLDEAVRKFRRQFPGIAVTVEAPEELLLVPMDPILICQVVFNLLENAARHGVTTTHIRLSLQSDGAFARFCVRDDGQGISPDALPTLFDGTLKSSPTLSIDGKRNMGLGLSVSMAIVRAHGGDMQAKNLEKGAEVSFRLPLREETFK